MYPSTEQSSEVPTDIEDYNFYAQDGVDIGRTHLIPDEARAIAEQERARAIGKPGNMNMNWH